MSRTDTEGRLQPPAQDRTAVRIAADFVDAFADYDPVRASRDLAVDADIGFWEDVAGESEWKRGQVWADAVGFRVLPGSCAPYEHDGSRTMVRCPFDMHSIGSDRIGEGPFPGNAFSVAVDGTEITASEIGHPVRDERLRGADMGAVHPVAPA